MIYKFINESHIVSFDGVLKINGIVFTGQSEENAKHNGFKELAVDEQPIIESNQYLTTNYEDTETAILQHWTVETIPEQEPSLEERICIVEDAVQDLILMQLGGDE